MLLWGERIASPVIKSNPTLRRETRFLGLNKMFLIKKNTSVSSNFLWLFFCLEISSCETQTHFVYESFNATFLYGPKYCKTGFILKEGLFSDKYSFFTGFVRLKVKLTMCNIIFYNACLIMIRPRWLIWMHRPTGDQEVAGSTPAEVGNILSWRLIMKYFLRSFSPFRWFKKSSCQFLAKECAQYW